MFSRIADCARAWEYVERSEIFLGIGTSDYVNENGIDLELDYEIYRKKAAVVREEGNLLRCCATFRAGEGVGTIREVGIFSKDSGGRVTMLKRSIVEPNSRFNKLLNDAYTTNYNLKIEDNINLTLSDLDLGI